MTEAMLAGEARTAATWPGWCCSYCAAPLEPSEGGLSCPVEGRWFSTQQGVHRLLPEERRRAMQPFVELYQRVRRDEGWNAEPGLPEVAASHPYADIWRRRAAHFARGIALAGERLGRGPWRVLDVGAGSGWAALRLREAGHRVAAIDVNLDERDGLFAANRSLDSPDDLPRAEAEMEAVPLEPASVDLVLLGGALHHAPRPDRTLVELRRVTRRDGILLALDSPVYRRSVDGEAMVAERMRRHREKYAIELTRETQSAYFVLSDLPALFRDAGWHLEIHGWPGRLREALRDVVEIGRWARRTARFPVLLGRRRG